MNSVEALQIIYEASDGAVEISRTVDGTWYVVNGNNEGKGASLGVAIGDCLFDVAQKRRKAIVPSERRVLSCPSCDTQHVDEGEWATRPHKTHLCAACGHEWRPEVYATVGVRAGGTGET